MKEKREQKNFEFLLILLALIVSFVVGIVLEGNTSVSAVFRPFGEIYIRLLKLTMIPLVTSSIIISISKVTNISKAGKIGASTVLLFVVTTAIAVIFGVVAAFLLHPGNIEISGTLSYEGKEMPSIADTIVGLFPDNALQVLSDGKMIPIIFLSIILGIAVERINTDEVKVFKSVVLGINQITTQVLEWIIKLTPLGIIGLMIPIVIENGFKLLIPLLKVLLVYYVALLLYNLIIYLPLLKMFSGKSIEEFYKSTASAQIFAFASCSSMATLPMSMQSLKKGLKISDEVVGFVLPLGATVNMDGNALYQGVIAVFVAQVFGIELSLGSIVAIVLAGTFASIGAAGVPGAGVIVLSAVLSVAGLPIEGVALVAGIDRVFDMGRTHTNVTGDMLTACIVDKILSKRSE